MKEPSESSAPNYGGMIFTILTSTTLLCSQSPIWRLASRPSMHCVSVYEAPRGLLENCQCVTLLPLLLNCQPNEIRWGDPGGAQKLAKAAQWWEGSIYSLGMFVCVYLLKTDNACYFGVHYNSRMAHTTQWLQAIQSCMRKVRLNISTVYGQFSCSNS